MAKLIVDSGGERREHVLKDPCRIGRDAENDIVLNDNGASRRHCRLSRDGDAWILEDLHSANGTFKNEERIDRTRLADGEVVRIGATHLKFLASDTASADSGDDAMEIELEAPATGGGDGGGGWTLIGVNGEVAGRRFDIKPPRLTIGRKSSNTVPLGDVKVSGVHCEVVYESGRPVLRDLGSTNGTFLEGKRIDEIALSHADRFGLGECVFVVADKREPEPELERREDESERTMIQAPGFARAPSDQMAALTKANVDAVKAGGSGVLGMLMLLVFVGGIGGAGWYFLQMKSEAAASAMMPPAADNLLGERWSFETGDAATSPAREWALATGSPETPPVSGDSAAPADGFEFGSVAGKGHTGETCLEASLTRGAVAELQEPVAAAARRRYSISGFARSEGEATALIGVEFRKKDDPTYRLRSVIGQTKGATWSPIAGSIVAPSEADGLVLKLIGAGSGGSVAFDDLSVVAEGSDKPAVKAAGAYEVESSGDAFLYRRNDETLMRALPPVVIAADGTRYDAGLFRAGENVLAGQAGAATVSVAVTTDPRKIVHTVNATLDASRMRGFVLPLDLRGALLDFDVDVLSAGRGLEPYRDSFEVEGATALVVGKGATRMRLTFQPAVAIKAVRDDQRFALELAPPATAARLTIETQVDFVAEVVDAAKAKDDAEAAFRRGALGETVEKLKSIRETYAFDENAMAAAELLRQNVEIETEKLKKEVAAAAARARYLRSESTYREAIAAAHAAATRLAGLEEAPPITAEADRLQSEFDVAVADRQSGEASRLLARLKTALSQTEPKTRIAVLIKDHLMKHFPNTDAAKQAAQLVTGGN